uniref:Uncharacterized protein MANES_03G089900 n=1 Tax=Rhizophora mucronata TaxID=61149 RepID=A0A2P2JYP6_RHIMU
MMSQPQAPQPHPQPQILGPQSQVMNHPVHLGQTLPHPALVQSQPAPMIAHNQAMNLLPPMMMVNQRGGYTKPWGSMDPNYPLKFNNNNSFAPSKPRSKNNKNWKGNNVNIIKEQHQQQQRRLDNKPSKPINNDTGLSAGVVGGGPSGGAGGYKPPSLNELQAQNRMKARKYYHPKKKFNNRFAPYAPRNTSSFIIRAKKSGGIASLVSPCPVTPAVLPTPIFSPSREVLGDMARQEWGVDGYGSMKGLIRLRSPVHDEEEDEGGNGSSESDVEEHAEVERRLDHDLSRFEMIYPSYGGVGGDGQYSYNNILENRVDDQDTHIAQLEEENLTLKERLFLMERELQDLRTRLQFLEMHQVGQGSSAVAVEDVNEEVVENVSGHDENENESDRGLGVGGTAGGESNDDAMDYVCGKTESRKITGDVKDECNDIYVEDVVPKHEALVKDEGKGEKTATDFSQQ